MDPLNWTEISVDNPPGDRRIHMSTPSTSFAPGEVLCYDYAVMTSSRLGNHIENASSLIEQAPDVQAFYDAQPDTYCDFTLSIPDFADEVSFEVYPNPSTGSFMISAEGEYTAAIYTLDGRIVFESATLFGQSTIQTSLANGTSILVTNQDGNLHPTKIIIQ
jgi:hypothetical protein